MQAALKISKTTTRTTTIASNNMTARKVSVIAAASVSLFCLLATLGRGQPTSQPSGASLPTSLAAAAAAAASAQSAINGITSSNSAVVAQQQQQQQQPASADQVAASATQNSIAQPIPMAGQQQPSAANQPASQQQLVPAAPAGAATSQQQATLQSSSSQVQPRLPKINIFISRTEMKKLLGIDNQLDYVTRGQLNLYPFGFQIPLGYNQSDIIFTWQNLAQTRVNYFISLIIGNLQALEPPIINITRSGSIPRHEQVFKISLPCSGKVTDEVDVQVLISIRGLVQPDEAELGGSEAATGAQMADSGEPARTVEHTLAIKRKKICTMHPQYVPGSGAAATQQRPQQPARQQQHQEQQPINRLNQAGRPEFPASWPQQQQHQHHQQQQPHPSLHRVMQQPTIQRQLGGSGGSPADGQLPDAAGSPPRPLVPVPLAVPVPIQVPAPGPVPASPALDSQPSVVPGGLMYQQQQQAAGSGHFQPPTGANDEPAPIPAGNPLLDLRPHLQNQRPPSGQATGGQQVSSSALLLCLVAVSLLATIVILIAHVTASATSWASGGSRNTKQQANGLFAAPAPKRKLIDRLRHSSLFGLRSGAPTGGWLSRKPAHLGGGGSLQAGAHIINSGKKSLDGSRHGQHQVRRHGQASAEQSSSRPELLTAANNLVINTLRFGPKSNHATSLHQHQASNGQQLLPVAKANCQELNLNAYCYNTSLPKQQQLGGYSFQQAGSGYYSSAYSQPPTADLLGTGYQCQPFQSFQQQQHQHHQQHLLQPQQQQQQQLQQHNHTTRLVWSRQPNSDTSKQPGGSATDGGAFLVDSANYTMQTARSDSAGSVYQTIY